MSDHTEPTDNGKISRREALATGAKVAGAAAFATPTVLGVFSSRASAGVPERCDPALDSDAIDLLEGVERKWNVNCSDNERNGRYNAQRTEASIEGTTVAINFGFFGTDNYPVECSFYWFDVPDGWECSATFVVGDANDTDGCPDGAIEHVSTPGDCTPWPTPESPTPADFLDEIAALQAEHDVYPVPWCEAAEGGVPTELPSGGYCVSKTFLWLTEWYCCPPA